jgi:hypothetical protein
MQSSHGEMPILANAGTLFFLFVPISIPGSQTKTEALIGTANYYLDISVDITEISR